MLLCYSKEKPEKSPEKTFNLVRVSLDVPEVQRNAGSRNNSISGPCMVPPRARANWSKLRTKIKDINALKFKQAKDPQINIETLPSSFRCVWTLPTRFLYVLNPHTMVKSSSFLFCHFFKRYFHCQLCFDPCNIVVPMFSSSLIIITGLFLFLFGFSYNVILGFSPLLYPWCV